jgi:hypothetical protein
MPRIPVQEGADFVIDVIDGNLVLKYDGCILRSMPISSETHKIVKQKVHLTFMNSRVGPLTSMYGGALGGHFELRSNERYSNTIMTYYNGFTCNFGDVTVYPTYMNGRNVLEKLEAMNIPLIDN